MIFRGAVISVGGSAEPIAKSLNEAKPAFVMFVVSEGSKPEVEANVLPRLGYVPQYNCISVADAGDLAACYETLRTAIPKWLAERALLPPEVYVDITGSTKPMSAALAMAGAEHFAQFCYVSGKERDKGGLGVVKTGTEEVFRTVNPWDKLAARERDRATWLFRSYYGEAAAEQLRQAAEKCGPELQQELKALAGLADCFASADRFQFADVYARHRKVRDQLSLIFSHRGQHSLFVALDHLADHWNSVAEERKGEGATVSATLRELLANAERRASQARRDDAVARLYRAAELFAQGKLQEAYGWKLGKASLEVSVSLPPENRRSLQGEFGPKLALQQAFRALGCSPRPGDREISGRYEAIKGHLQKRNESILAHGLRAAREEDFQSFWNALLPVVEVTEGEIPRWPGLEF